MIDETLIEDTEAVTKVETNGDGNMLPLILLTRIEAVEMELVIVEGTLRVVPARMLVLTRIEDV